MYRSYGLSARPPRAPRDWKVGATPPICAPHSISPTGRAEMMNQNGAQLRADVHADFRGLAVADLDAVVTRQPT